MVQPLLAPALECRVLAAERLLACAMGPGPLPPRAGKRHKKKAAVGLSDEERALQAAAAANMGGSPSAAQCAGGRRGAGFLRAAVGALGAQEATVVLLVLRRLLVRVSKGEVLLGLAGGFGSTSTDRLVVLPSFGSVCEWCGALLDAHFSSLVFSSSSSSSSSSLVGSSPFAECLRSLSDLLAQELQGAERCSEAGQRLAGVMAGSKRRTEAALRQAAGAGGVDSAGGASYHGGGRDVGAHMVEYSVEALCI
jgi:hypothetical protein